MAAATPTEAWVHEAGLPHVTTCNIADVARGPIAAAIDLGDADGMVIRRAIELARATQSRLILLGATAESEPLGLATMRLQAAARLCRRAGISAHPQLLVTDDPGAAVLSAARAAAAGTIVVGVDRWPSWSCGSTVAAHIVNHSRCPVVIEKQPHLP